jgi:hypothetical protein
LVAVGLAVGLCVWPEIATGESIAGVLASGVKVAVSPKLCGRNGNAPTTPMPLIGLNVCHPLSIRLAATPTIISAAKSVTTPCVARRLRRLARGRRRLTAGRFSVAEVIASDAPDAPAGVDSLALASSMISPHERASPGGMK